MLRFLRFLCWEWGCMEDSNPKYHPLSFVDIVIFLHQFLFPPGVARLGSQPLNSPPPICGLGRLSCCDQCFALFTRSTYPPHRGKVLVRYRQPPPPLMLTCQELGRTQPLNHGPFPGWGRLAWVRWVRSGGVNYGVPTSVPRIRSTN